MERFDVVEAIFQPRRLDDLKAPDLVGKRLRLMAGWLIDEGPYQGEWAMVDVPGESVLPPGVVWIPSGDFPPGEAA